MPHDKHGMGLRVGDVVMVPCRIKAIHLTEDYCNVDLETTEGMPPLLRTSTLTLNSKQTIKTNRTLPPDPGWRDIASAPGNRTPVLVGMISAGRLWRVTLASFNGMGHCEVGSGKACSWRTHWMPAPPPVAGPAEDVEP